MATADDKLAVCDGCHAASKDGQIGPAIGGQPVKYLQSALLEYKAGHRPASMMAPALLEGFSEADINALAEQYSKRTWASIKQKLDPTLIEKGKAIAEEKCAMCHGQGGRQANAEMPRLGGQQAAFLATEIEEFHNAQTKLRQPRGMRLAIQKLPSEAIKALAEYYASQQ